MGLLSKADKGVLTAYCMAWARVVESEGHLVEGGIVVPGRQEGLVRSPWLIVQTQNLDLLRKFAAELGLSPIARTRLPGKAKEQRPLSELAAERAAAVRAAARKNPA